MNEHEGEQQQEDFEVELIDLDAAQARGRRQGESALDPRPTRVSLRSRASPRRRVLRLVSSIVLLILALVALGSFLSARNSGVNTPLATPAPYIILGSNLFYVNMSPPWGKLYLDGRLLAHPPLSMHDRPLALSQGRHRFDWIARPFQPLRCFISVPTLNSDSCIHTVAQVPATPEAQLILLYETLNTLPQAQRQALTVVAQQALNRLASSDLVQPRERFLHEQGSRTIDVASRPLEATLRWSLDTADTVNKVISSCKVLVDSCILQFQDLFQDCLLFCPQSFYPITPTSATVWQVIAVAHTTWDYTTLDGQVVALAQPDALPAYTQFAHFLSLQITWDGSTWSVIADINATQSSGIGCITADNTFDALTATLGSQTPVNMTLSQSSVSAPVAAAGCLERIVRQSLSPSGPFVQPTMTPANTAYALYRFGLFLAANELAQRYWPGMLRANAYERTLAQQLGAQTSLP